MNSATLPAVDLNHRYTGEATIQTINNNQRVIHSIKDLSLRGNKIGLFIGRTLKEELPVEENVVWISFDKIVEGDLSSRLHIVGNINQIDKKLEGLFDKVVVDQSTWKFFDEDPIPYLKGLLKINSTSELIFENAFQVVSFRDDLPENEFDYSSGLLNISMQNLYSYETETEAYFENFCVLHGGLENIKATEEYASFLALIADDYDSYDGEEDIFEAFKEHIISGSGIQNPFTEFKDLAEKQMVDRLQKVFDQALLIKNSTYPYWTHYSKPGLDQYYRAVGPKAPAERWCLIRN